MIDVLARASMSARYPLVQAAQEHGFLPYFRELQGRAGPTVVMDGGSKIMLGSNNYLGLTGDPRVMHGARAALDRYGTAMTGSRLLNGTTRLHEELEHDIAEWMNTEAALTFTTGYQTNLSLLSALMTDGDVVVCDSRDHASIVDGVALSGADFRSFRHNRPDRLDAVLGRVSAPDRGILAIVDGVFSMEGDVSPLGELLAVCERHGVSLVVDEAHSVGVLGERGTGACEALGVCDRVALRVGTFSKSLASCGGFAVGPTEVIDFLRIDARPFLFTAAAVPAAVGAALEAVRITRSPEGGELMARLADNASYLHAGLVDLGYQVVDNPTPDPLGRPLVTPIVPVLIGDDVNATCLWKALFDAGVYVNVATYPAVPRDGALLRASVMATHGTEDLDTALRAFEAVRDEAEQGAFTGV